MKRVGLAILSVMMLVSLPPCAAGAGDARALVVRVPPALVVDHPKNSAAGLIYLRNPSTTPVRVHLTAEDFIATSTGKLLGTTVSFSAPGAAAGASVYDGTLQPGELQTIEVEVTNVWEAGESKAKLRNQDQEVATLRAVKYRVPLGVKIVGAGDGPVVVAFQRGQPREVVLKNEDGMTYHVDWRLTVGAAAAKGRAELPPNWTTPISVTPPPEWFTAPFEGLFKDETREGTLAVRLSPSSDTADAALPERVIPLRAQLAYWSSAWRNPVTMTLVFLALLAGGLCSLLLNQWLPNRLRRIDLEERLGAIAARTRNLSYRVDSSARILARVERYRLLRLLGSRYSFSPEMGRVLTVAAQATDRLEAKVGLLERIDAVCRDLLRLRLSVPPTLAAAAGEGLLKAGDRVRSALPTDPDLQEAAALVTEAAGRLNRAGQADDELVKGLVERFRGLRDTLGPQSALRKDKKGADLALRLPGLFDYLDGPAPDPSLRPERYADHDLSLLRLDLVHQYLRRYGEQSDAGRRRLEECAEPLFVEYVEGATPEKYEQARLVLTAMRQDVYTSDVEVMIRSKQIRIEAQPADPRPHQAVELSAVFNNDDLNSCGARDQFECLWLFEHPDSEGGKGKWKEKGWRVHHFFPKPGQYTVKATFQKKDGSPVANKEGDVEVREGVEVGPDTTSRFGDRTWIEAMRFSIVLFATVLGLLGGAREQLMKLDVMAGLVAVFLIGFGADAVKNILVDRGGVSEPARR